MPIFMAKKGHYGVAMLCKKEPLAVQYGFPTDNDEHQKRMIMVTLEDEQGEKMQILNGYFPQGENQNHETKYPYKRQFYQDLNTYLETHHSPEGKILSSWEISISRRST